MTREELFGKIKDALGSTQLTLSERTVNEELDDALADFGDDDEANGKLVTRVANRLKRMDGNLHADVSKQVSEYKSNLDGRGNGKGGNGKESEEGEDEIPEWAKALRADLEAERNARKQREAKDAKDAMMASVRKGLKDKFEASGLEVNEYFVEAALSKLEIPQENADLGKLVGEAESLYCTDYKRANHVDAIPRKGEGGGNKDGEPSKTEWDDIKEAHKS